MDNYICKIATIEEMSTKWDYEIEHSIEDKENWVLWKKEKIERFKKRGYEKVTLGVEPKEIKNKEIYFKYGFTEHIKDSKEFYPDGTEIDVEYYGKKI